MPMAPHNSPHRPNIHPPSLLQNLIDIPRDIQPRNPILDRRLRRGGEIPPVFPAAEIEEDGFAEGGVPDEEGEGGEVHGFVAGEDGLHEGAGGHDDVGCGVDDGDGDGGLGFGEVEAWSGLGFDVVVVLVVVRHGFFKLIFYFGPGRYLGIGD